MSKKYLAILVIPALIFAVALIAMPKDAAASQLLGITITPTPTDTETPTPTGTESPTPTPTMTVTEEPDTPTPTPSLVQQRPTNTPRPQETEVVLLPETGEFPIDPAQGIQWFFALSMILLIGVILIRTFRAARIKK